MKLGYLFAALCICPIWAQAEIYKAVDQDGHVTYSSTPLKGGKKIILEPLPTMMPPKMHTFDGFPKVDNQTQRGRDDTRRKILQDELSAEEKLLEEAQNMKQRSSRYRIRSICINRISTHFKQSCPNYQSNYPHVWHAFCSIACMSDLPYLTLEYLATAVILLDDESRIAYINPSAEHLFDMSDKNLHGLPLQQVFSHTEQLASAMQQAVHNNASYIEHDLTLGTHAHGKLHLRCAATPLQFTKRYLLLEFHPMDRPLKLAREEQMLDQTQANRLLLRNLAHEIKNPLGGIRGAAQLLEQELEKPALREYTQVIVQEADRLRSLMEKLLAPQNASHYSALNIHEVLERVRSVVLAEMAEGLMIKRDYDFSLPALVGDKEQLIQAMLNIVRNAAQAMEGNGLIVLRTRIARQVTLIKRRHRLAVTVQIIDNGPGIPAELQDKIFYPLVSGRADGHGLGLTLAQDFVSQHHGMIEFDSEPGRTRFTVLLPLP
jgi:two-component system nitrogen regulation sensor histidine kinase GlnL